ncbi:hypothetical protein [Delftia tsuruhatensis]|uniref:hypothetical protein n=1 Tax=Delftia tsuruhatensis TaxID=180282 RepID=UPI00370A9041
MNQRILWAAGLALPVALLGGALAWMWLTPQLQLKNTAWEAPRPIKADIQSLVPAEQALSGNKLQGERQLLEMHERPLFVMNRRPPPPPPPPEPEKKVEEIPDAWVQARVTGIFEGPVTGIIVHIDGKERRLMLNQSFAGWKLQGIEQRSILLERGGQIRSLQLAKAALDKGPSIPASMRVPSVGAGPSPGSNSGESASERAEGEAGAPPARPAPRAVFGGTSSRK